MIEKSSSQPALIAVDWGSSNFRSFLLDQRGQILSEVSAAKGMLNLDKEQFESTLFQQISPWINDQGKTENSSNTKSRLPILMAGMVGSAQGWSDAGYISCPADAMQAAEQLHKVTNQAQLNIHIVPGVKCQTSHLQPDVMRGEEVQAFGAVALLEQELGLLNNTQLEKLVFCLPGTHSKWIRMAKSDAGDAVIDDLSTHMTGEVYNLIVEHSILGKGLANTNNEMAFDIASFLQGVHTSQREGGLLHHLFSARTLRLEQRLTESDVTSYISGVLIGAELNAVLTSSPNLEHIYLIGGSQLNYLYSEALKELGYLSTTVSSSKASAVGMLNIAKQAKLVTSKDKG
ncbi:2-dehydro-3-deoxygalactonokinase [Shewanella sp. MMG014]|uniref:2-dehydro-3-deoxygalactonokinase n=1 Tax=Shewanella sp. MMG014 TaxID=2822691 RepID=UPI001B363A40|nr:2-dehydro-3-deoxygalactonokinase [Shewanella sp. MMG014]MBQ4891641.1 2-dehydro-3-deoxygalactonokinase [Shewanella sp. MMG014]